MTTGAMTPGQALTGTPSTRRSCGEDRPRRGVGAVVRQRHHAAQSARVGHAAIACLRVSEATRQRCAYSAEVRNSASRG